MKNRLIQNRVGLAVFAAGLLFMAAGAYRQEIGTVMTKAIAICLECVGIG